MGTGTLLQGRADPVMDQALHALVTSPKSTAVAREHWKYTRVEKITALLDGLENAPPATLNGLEQSGLTVAFDVQPDDHELAFLRTRSTYCPATAKALLTARSIDRVLIEKDLREPLLVLQTDARRPLMISIGQGVSARIHDLSTSDSGWLIVEQQADSNLDFTRLHTPADAPRWHQLQFVLKRNAALSLQHYCTGTTLSRLDVFVGLMGSGSSADVHSCWMADDKDHLDQQWHIEHHAPHTRSAQMQHGIADGKAVTTYRGRIFIGVDCPDVDASLINRNLSLSASAVCNTKPELEINTDDVRCSHGATVGQLPEESMFYFQSRGVDRDTARQMLAAGFINQCLRGDLADVARLRMLGIAHE
jgi:SUF system FeS cluster assembly, SufBD